MNRKGMSQTLALIVAAMVLMMTALTLIFMTQGSLDNLFSGSQEQSCISTAQSSCNAAGSGSITVPACEDVDWAGSNGISTSQGSAEVSCP